MQRNASTNCFCTQPWARPVNTGHSSPSMASPSGHPCWPWGLGFSGLVKHNQGHQDKWSLQSIKRVDRCGWRRVGPWLRNYWSLIMETHDPCELCLGESQTLLFFFFFSSYASNLSVALGFLIRREMRKCIKSDLFRYRILCFIWCLNPKAFVSVC